MLGKFGSDLLTKGIEDKCDPFFSRQFGGWDEIAISRDQNDSIDKLFEAKPGDVDSDFHIDLFLGDLDPVFLFIDLIDGDFSPKEFIVSFPVFEGPMGPALIQSPQPQCRHRHLTDIIMEMIAHLCSCTFGQVDAFPCFGVFHFFV